MLAAFKLEWPTIQFQVLKIFQFIKKGFHNIQVLQNYKFTQMQIEIENRNAK